MTDEFAKCLVDLMVTIDDGVDIVRLSESITNADKNASMLNVIKGIPNEKFYLLWDKIKSSKFRKDPNPIIKKLKTIVAEEKN